MLPILIVDDEPHIARLIEMTLEPLGQPLVLACDGEQAADLLEKQQFDLVLLDVMLPGVDGFALMDYIAPTGTPVIFLTAKNAVADRVRGLKLGAYDYIVKPFDAKEVTARIKAVLRRCARPSHVLHLSGLTLDQDAHTVSCDGQRVPLTYKEYELLRLFLSHPGMAFTRDQLMAQVWGTDYYGETRTVDMHIRTLRQKLGPYGSLIQTVRNVGYRLEEQG